MSIFEVSKGIDLLPYDITKAPGLAGRITNDINAQANRLQPRLAVLSALHIISCACCPHSRSPRGMKLNLITVGIAPTGSGKDIGIQYMKKALSINGISVEGQINSAQLIGKTLIHNNGMAFFVIDEAHNMFDAMVSPRAPQYQREIGGEVLSVYSDRLKMFSLVVAKNIKEDVEKERLLIKKVCKDEGIVEGSPEEDSRLEKVKRKIDMVEKGITDPFFSLAAYSTPANLEKIFCAENMDSGLAGRVIFVRAPEERAEAQFVEYSKMEICADVSLGVAKLKSRGGITVTWHGQDAVDLAKKIHYAFEKIRNDGSIGAVATRGFELVEKVASIIALGDGGAIKVEHLSWAFQFILESITDTWASSRVNESQDDDGWHARWTELSDKVVRVLIGTTSASPVSASQIVQRVFRSKKSRLYKLCSAAYPADIERGKKEFVRMALTQMLSIGAVDKDGSKFWLFSPENIEKMQPSQEFVDVYNNVGRFSAFMR